MRRSHPHRFSTHTVRRSHPHSFRSHIVRRSHPHHFSWHPHHVSSSVHGFSTNASQGADFVAVGFLGSAIFDLASDSWGKDKIMGMRFSTTCTSSHNIIPLSALTRVGIVRHGSTAGVAILYRGDFADKVYFAMYGS